MTDRSKLLALAEIDPALVERMAVHILECDEVHGIRPKDADSRRRYDEMKAIAALLPRPVDPDLIEARGIAKPWLIYDGAYSIDNGYCDEQPAMKAILTAIKRGRELAQAEALS